MSKKTDIRNIGAQIGPFMHAPETARSIFSVISVTATLPLIAGIVIFGWHAAIVAAVAVGGCVLFERFYFAVTRTPAMLGRSHAYLTGVLLAMTLPAYVPWYVPLVAAAFAVLVGKAVFGGVGHFLWQPALVGRLAVAVIFGPGIPLLPTAMEFNKNFPTAKPVLARSALFGGDITDAARVSEYYRWSKQAAPDHADALLVTPPSVTLHRLTRPPVTDTGQVQPAYSGLAVPADLPHARPAVLMRLPVISDLFYGVRPGGIGETCIIVLLVAGLYLVYRNYVPWQLPLSMLLAAWITAAVAPIVLEGPNQTVETVWWPLWAQGLDVGFTYVNYQVLSGQLILAALFLAPEMTTRPVTTGGQVLFGIGCGVLGMLLQLYFDIRVPIYMAVLAMNTLTPSIDALWRPRVLGRKWFHLLRQNEF